MKWQGILYSAAVLYVVLPVFAFAQTQSTSTGLVPCSGISCTPCDLYSLIQRIVNYLIGLSVPIAVLLMAYAGILLFTANAEPAKISKARRIFSSALVGFLIALSGWLLVQTIINILVSQEYQVGWSWNKLACNGETRLGVNGQDITVSDWLNETIGQGKTVPITTPPPPPSLNPTCSNPSIPTKNLNTVKVSTYCISSPLGCTDTEARNAINAYNTQAGNNTIIAPGNVSFNTINPTLLQDVLDNVDTANAGQIIIDSAYRPGSGSRHNVGDAIDLGFNNTNFNNFIKNCGKPFTSFCDNPSRPGYIDSIDGLYWTDEYAAYGNVPKCANSDGDHWHVSTDGH